MNDERFEYTRKLLVSGNVAILLWTLLATLAVWFSLQLVAWLFLLITLGTIFLFLRRIGCSTCAYCKSCTSGFGRLSAWFFGKSKLKDLNNKTALAFVVLVYFLLSVVPVTLTAFSIYQSFDLSKSLVLLFLAAASICSLITWVKPSKK